MNTVTSPDGTMIGYDRTGTGAPLVLPDGRLIERRRLGHTKKLNAKAIAATLTEFLTDHDTAPRA